MLELHIRQQILDIIPKKISTMLLTGHTIVVLSMAKYKYLWRMKDLNGYKYKRGNNKND